MGTWEIAFRVKYDYPFAKMSEKYPGTRISMWCVWDREMVHVPLSKGDVVEEVETYAGQIGRIIEGHKRTLDGFVVTMKCTCDLNRNVWDLTNRNHCVEIHPAVFLDGWGYYRIISFDENDSRKFFTELGELGKMELISKRELHLDAIPSTVWTESFFSRLTEKQMDSLVKAYDYGYYASPREITTESIASSVGVSRSTYEEHLRKAENRIMEAIIPYLKLFRAGIQNKDEAISPEIKIAESA